MTKQLFIDKLLRPLCKAIDDNIAFLLPVFNEDEDVVTVIVGYKNNTILRVNVECDNLKGIVCDVIKHIQKG